MMFGACSILCALCVVSTLVDGQGEKVELLPESSNVSSLFELVLPETRLVALFNSPQPSAISIVLLVDPSVLNFSIGIESTKPYVASVIQGSIEVAPCSNLSSTGITQVNTSQSNSSLVEYSYSASTLPPTNGSTEQICYNISFQVDGNQLGYSTLVVKASLNDQHSNVSVEPEQIGSAVIACLRHYRLVDLMFKYSITVLICVALFGMGNELNFETIKTHLKKPKAPAIAFISQYTFMPALSLAIIYLAGYEGGWALGLFAYGCSPGGGTSNIYSKLLNGDMSISVTMTTLSTVASVGMLPIYLYTLGSLLPVSEEIGRIQIPFSNLIISLLTIIVPLVLGALFQYKVPRGAEIVKKFLKAFLMICMLFFLTVGIYSNLYIYETFDMKMISTALILPVGGYLFGGLFAFACRMEWKLIKTISIETAMQNPAISFLIVQSVLTAPDTDLAIIPVAAVSLVTSVPALLLAVGYTIYQCHLKKKRSRGSVSKLNEVKKEEEMVAMNASSGNSDSASDAGSIEEKGELLENNA